MNAQTLIDRCERQAKAYSSDRLASMAFEIGMLRAELRAACEATEDGAGTDYRVQVTFGSARPIASFTLDSSDDICLTGVWVGGANIIEGLTDEQLSNIDSQIQHNWHAVDKQIRERNADMQIERVAV